MAKKILVALVLLGVCFSPFSALAQTGVVDSATWQVIFPTSVQLKILTPNGGETWDKSTSHVISWQATVAPITPTDSAAQPFYHQVSIDLIRDSGAVYHIATTDLYQTQYSWTIKDNIPAASDYRIRISVGGMPPCALNGGQGKNPCPMYYPQYSYSDTSDNTFAITGSNYPNPDAILKIKAMIDNLQRQIDSLNSQLQSLRDLVNSL